MKKEGKKWMLVAIALLAVVTVVLPLVGCKNDSVAEPVRYTVTFAKGENAEFTDTLPPDITVTSGTQLTEAQLTDLKDTTNYNFVGWFDQNNKRVSVGTAVTEDLMLTAFWINKKMLTFTSDSDTHLKVTYNGSIGVPTDMEYSTDGENWTDFKNPQDQIPFGNGTELYLRGESSTGTATDTINYINFTFKDGTKVSASGDIRTLVDWDDPVNAVTSNARFSRLFEDCDELVTAPKLPAKTLATYCYMGMFYGCTSLTTAPELKAETLAENCYSNMFTDCTSLTTAPALPATTLADHCYEGMFSDCTKLASVTMLATNVSASEALHAWLYGTAGGTLYVANNDMVNDPIILKYKPSSWTVAVASTGEQPN